MMEALYQALCSVMVAISIVAVFFTPPVGSPFTHQHTVRLMNFATVAFFVIDAAVKCVAHGVLLTPTAYLQASSALTHFNQATLHCACRDICMLATCECNSASGVRQVLSSQQSKHSNREVNQD